MHSGRFLEEYAKATYENAFKSRLFAGLLTHNYGAVTATHSGEWMNHLTSDTVVVSEGLATIVPGVAGMVTTQYRISIAQVEKVIEDHSQDCAIDENLAHIIATDDADAGEFTYICLAPDTPATTWHIEFRYGDALEALGQMYEGNYAFWQAAGMLEDADEEMIDNCIELFCTENASEK